MADPPPERTEEGGWLILHLSAPKRERVADPPPERTEERGWLILHLSGAKGEVDRQLVGGPEGDGEAVLDLVDGFANPLRLIDGFANPLRLAAYPAAIHLPRPTGWWRM